MSERGQKLKEGYVVRACPGHSDGRKYVWRCDGDGRPTTIVGEVGTGSVAHCYEGMPVDPTETPPFPMQSIDPMVGMPGAEDVPSEKRISRAHTPRGFRVFWQQDKLRVQESSRAFEGPHCWIFDHSKGREDGVELTLDEAHGVILGLQAFIDEAMAGKLAEREAAKGADGENA